MRGTLIRVDYEDFIKGLFFHFSKSFLVAFLDLSLYSEKSGFILFFRLERDTGSAPDLGIKIVEMILCKTALSLSGAQSLRNRLANMAIWSTVKEVLIVSILSE